MKEETTWFGAVLIVMMGTLSVIKFVQGETLEAIYILMMAWTLNKI